MRQLYKYKGYAIRLCRIGCHNRPFYQIGVILNSKRVGRFPEEVIGSYDPMPNEYNEKLISIDLERLAFWLGKGALPSWNFQELLGLVGFYPIHPYTYKKAWTARLKAINEKQDTTSEAQTNQ